MHHVFESLHLKKAKMFHYNVIVYDPPLDTDGAAPLSGTITITCINITTLIKKSTLCFLRRLNSAGLDVGVLGFFYSSLRGFVKSAEDYQEQLNVHQGHLHRQVQ